MNATARVVTILTCLGLAGMPRGVTEIGKDVGVSKSSVQRILSSLKSAGWVGQDPQTRKYTLGSRVLEIGLSMMSQLDLRSASLPYMYRLRNATGETAMLSIRVGSERVYIEQIQGSHEVRQIVQLGSRHPLWLGAPGKAMLAYMEKDEIEAVMDNLRKSGIHVFASGQVMDIDRLREELAEVRRRGFAVTVGERLVAVLAVAAPVFGRDHKVVGCISVGGPLPRFTVDLALYYGPSVGQAAKKVSLQLGDFAENVGMDD